MPAAPSIVQSSSGLACNNACRFCAQGTLRTHPTVPGALGELPTDLEGRTVTFVGGEPTLAPELPLRLGEAVAKGAARIVLQTNGRRLAYASYAAALAEAARGRLWLEVSLHGSSQEMHDFHTRVPGSFVQTIAGLRNARAAGIQVAVGVVVTRSNYRHLADIVRIAQALGVVAVRAAVVLPLGSARTPPGIAAPPDAMLGPHVDAARLAAERAGIAWLPPDGLADPRFPFAGVGATETPPAEVASMQGQRDDERS